MVEPSEEALAVLRDPSLWSCKAQGRTSLLVVIRTPCVAALLCASWTGLPDTAYTLSRALAALLCAAANLVPQPRGIEGRRKSVLHTGF